MDIRKIEELSLNAWPSLKQILYDGWLLRFAGGFTRRANSVNPLYSGELNVEQKIRFCEAVYREAGLPAVFKMTAASQPAGLAGALAAAGYRPHAATSVQTLDMRRESAKPPMSSECGFELSLQPTEAWLDGVAAFTRLKDMDKPLLRAIVGGIAAQTCFASAIDADGICACALGVMQDGWVGLFDVVTHPERRRLGFGRRLVQRLIDWGRAGGATTAYLQVMLDNSPALSLYEGIGFREVYQYEYLVKRIGD